MVPEEKELKRELVMRRWRVYRDNAFLDGWFQGHRGLGLRLKAMRILRTFLFLWEFVCLLIVMI